LTCANIFIDGDDNAKIAGMNTRKAVGFFFARVDLCMDNVTKQSSSRVSWARIGRRLFPFPVALNRIPFEPQDHGYGTTVLRGMPIYSPAKPRKDGTLSWRWYTAAAGGIRIHDLTCNRKSGTLYHTAI